MRLLFLVSICFATIFGCRHSVLLKNDKPIFLPGLNTTKVEVVDLSAENWLVGTITDRQQIDQIQKSMLDAKELPSTVFPSDCKCQFRFTAGDQGVSIRYDKKQGLVKLLTHGEVSTYRLTDSNNNFLATLLERQIKID